MNEETQHRFVELRRAVIKEEYVAITGNVFRAVVLNQMLYWSERVRDFDKFIREENEVAEQNGEAPRPLMNGWFYKTASQIAEETMLGIDDKTMRKHIAWLVDAGFIRQRTNPNNKWGRTLQYRVNLKVITQALREKGYELQGYKRIPRYSDVGIPIGEYGDTNIPNYEIESGNFPNRTSQNAGAIPKITTEITTKTTAKREQSTNVDCREKENERKRKPFKPPTIEEVRTYVEEINGTTDPKAFFDYFEAGEWFDSEGKPVLNWKQKLQTWEKLNKSKKNTVQYGFKTSKPFTYDYSDTEGSI